MASVQSIFGVRTTHTIASVIESSELTKFTQGGDAARSAIDMATVMRRLRAGEETPPSVEARESGAPRIRTRARSLITVPRRFHYGVVDHR